MNEPVKIDYNENLSVAFCNGQVAGLWFKGHEFIHGGSLPEDWRSVGDKQRIENGAPEYSNLVAFPYGGLPNEVFVGHRELISKGRHGLSRHLSWEEIGKRNCAWDAVYQQTHDGKTSVRDTNKLGSDDSADLDPAFPYEILKLYALGSEGVLSRIMVANHSSEYVSYSIWDHPIFIPPKNPEAGVFYSANGNELANLQQIGCQDIPVMLFNNAEGILFKNYENRIGFSFQTSNFGNLMIWSPLEKGVFSIEAKSHPDFQESVPDENSRYLKPWGSDSYYTYLMPFKF